MRWLTYSVLYGPPASIQNNNIHEQLVINPNGTFVAGPYTGIWTLTSGGNIYLEQTGGPTCDGTSNTEHFYLSGSVLNAALGIYGGTATCNINLHVGGLPAYISGTWTYQ